MKSSSLLLIVLAFGLSMASCVNDCNSHGDCLNEACVCEDGWGGSDCSIFDQSINSGETKSGSLEIMEWKYYHLTLSHYSPSIIVDVIQTSDFGDIDLYVSTSPYPSNNNYLVKDTSTGVTLHITIDDASPNTYYFGLYGYWASDYQITVTSAGDGCVYNCGEHGQCSGDTCACYENWVGPDCSFYNEVLQVNVGVSDTVEDYEYKYYQFNGYPGETAVIYLLQDNDNYDLDLFAALDRFPTQRDYDYMNASVTQDTELYIPDMIDGIYQIGVYGYIGGHYTLVVDLEDEQVSSCYGECSLHGDCNSDTCVCETDFFGIACESYDPLMELDTWYTGYAGTGLFNYWKVRYFSESPLRITVNSDDASGDIDLLVRQNINPTINSYQFSDLSLEQDFSLVIENPGDIEWHIGLYGYIGTGYSIQVTTVEECLCNDSSHGHCQDGSSDCLCEIGYAGETCEIEAYALQNGEVRSQDSVEPHSWNYYHFSSDGSGVIITMKESDSRGDLLLLVSLSGFPEGNNFEYYDISDSDFHEIQISWSGDRVMRTYFIAVVTSTVSVANDALPYQLTAYGTPF